jgi:hypothetical protein
MCKAKQGEETQMNYPSAEQVEAADHEQLCRWTRFLPSPGMYAVGRKDFEQILESQGKTMDRIVARLKEAGGFTPEISKKIGWSGSADG